MIVIASVAAYSVPTNGQVARGVSLDECKSTNGDLAVRIAAWNTNYNNNNKKRSFEDVIAMADPLHADILVLSETWSPKESCKLPVEWVGQEGPGLAIVACSDLHLTPHPANGGAPPLVGGYAVHGRVNFKLLAAWPVKLDGGDSYHNVLIKSLKRFEDVLGAENSLFAGDLNSSTGVSDQRVSHPKFVEEAEKLGLASLYHEQTGENHGDESVKTYRHGNAKQFHLDYCFASRRLRPAANISVLRGGDWSSRSDHFPVVVDIPDAAFAQERIS